MLEGPAKRRKCGISSLQTFHDFRVKKCRSTFLLGKNSLIRVSFDSTNSEFIQNSESCKAVRRSAGNLEYKKYIYLVDWLLHGRVDTFSGLLDGRCHINAK